jgi:hypothetical protein
MKADELPRRELRALQAATVVAIVGLVVLLALRRIWLAMIVGVLLLGGQKAYLHFRERKGPSRKRGR